MEKGADVLREMIGFARRRWMGLEVEAKTGASYGEKDQARLTQCNGYRERDWQTRAIVVELPALIQEAQIWGVSIRSVDALVQAMGGTGVAKSKIFHLPPPEIDTSVGAFLDRLIESYWPYLWIEATYLKARQEGRVVSVAVIVVAVGVNADDQPNEASTRRLVDAPLLEQTDEWVVQRARHVPREALSDVNNPPLNFPHGKLMSAAQTRPMATVSEATPRIGTQSRGGDERPLRYRALMSG